jgi:hypothetical protein
MTSHVRVDIGNGQIVTSFITNEAVDDLGIKAKSAVDVAAGHLAVSSSHLQRLPFDNGSYRRIDIPVPRQRAVAR